MGPESPSPEENVKKTKALCCSSFDQ